MVEATARAAGDQTAGGTRTHMHAHARMHAHGGAPLKDRGTIRPSCRGEGGAMHAAPVAKLPQARARGERWRGGSGQAAPEAALGPE